MKWSISIIIILVMSCSLQKNPENNEKITTLLNKDSIFVDNKKTIYTKTDSFFTKTFPNTDLSNLTKIIRRYNSEESLDSISKLEIWHKPEYFSDSSFIYLSFLKNLRSLDMIGLDQEFPNNIDKLKQLRYLRVSSCKLPPGIGKLKNLEHLSLSGNDLKNREIYDLKIEKLTYIDSFDDTLVIPPMIGNLKTLKTLVISKASVVELPKEIGHLNNLKELSISGGKSLSSVPKEIGNCESLENIFFWRNKLQTLPDEIANLRKLKKLNLGENRFTKKEQIRIKKLLPNTKIDFRNN